MEETEAKRLRDEEDRRQIELYKKAILEIEVEKLNVADQATAREKP